eukprot:scaffold6695_cov136-Isochrysis_galbana.AAC.6
MSRNSDWNLENPEGCCSGQLFAVVVMGGAATPKGVFAALTTHAKSLSSELWPVVDRQNASSALCRLRAGTRVSRGREIIPVVNSHRCCRRGHAPHLCSWPKPPQWAPAEAVERHHRDPSTRARNGAEGDAELERRAAGDAIATIHLLPACRRQEGATEGHMTHGEWRAFVQAVAATREHRVHAQAVEAG